MDYQTRYARSADGTQIAYTTIGQGRPLVFVGSPSTMLTIETDSHIPRVRRALEKLAQHRMVVRTDPRGRGLSDHDAAERSLDAHVADVVCVVEALAQETVDLVAVYASAPIAISYAARHPERVRKLVLSNGIARGRDRRLSPLRRKLAELADIDFDFFKQATSLLNLGWDEGRVDAEAMNQLTAEELTAGWRASRGFDASDDLPHVLCPVMVLFHRSAEEYTPLSASRELASSMPNAELRLIHTKASLTLFDEQAVIAGIIEEFLDGDPATPASVSAPPGTAIILFADIVDSTALTERIGDAAFRDKARALDDALRIAVRDNGGAVIDAKTLGDGILATFPAASQAIAAALACGAAGNAQGLPLHLGLHAGDVIRESDNVFGGAVNIASRISALSAPGEVLVSDIVRGLARTSAGVLFEDRGEHALKGIAEPQRVYAVRKADS